MFRKGDILIVRFPYEDRPLFKRRPVIFLL